MLRLKAGGLWKKQRLVAARARQCAKELARLAKNPEQLRNLAFYASVKHNGEFVNINRLKATMPQDGKYWSETAGEETPF